MDEMLFIVKWVALCDSPLLAPTAVFACCLLLCREWIFAFVLQLFSSIRVIK